MRQARALEELEAQSIEIIREAAAGARIAVMLDSADKRAWVMLRLARKAFHPAPPPIAVVRPDVPPDPHADVVFDPAAGGIATPPPRNMHARAGETLRVLPLSGWSERDILRYVERESGGDATDVAPASARPRSPSGPSFRMPVQLVLLADGGFRGFSGRVAAGRIAVGDAVRVLPSGVDTRVKAILRGFHAPTVCEAGESVTLTLMDDVEVARGDVIAAVAGAPHAADQFEARLTWMDDHPMVAGRAYLLKIHAKEVSAQVTAIKYREDLATGAHLAARQLQAGETAVVNLATSETVVFERHAETAALAAFILVDKLTLRTAGAGTIEFALRRAANLHWQLLALDKQARAQSMHQRPRCIWLTGLSGSGKSTLANLLEKRLHAQGRHTYVLDGDNVRHGLNRDLGFTEPDRVENIRRVAEVARLMVDAGLIVIVSFISPFRAERRTARALFQPGEFVEVFVDTPLEECERRDPKGLYAKARRGELGNFTGIDSPYEPPQSPDVHVHTVGSAPEDSVREIIERL